MNGFLRGHERSLLVLICVNDDLRASSYEYLISTALTRPLSSPFHLPLQAESTGHNPTLQSSEQALLYSYSLIIPTLHSHR